MSGPGDDGVEPAGTLANMAPEPTSGRPSSEAADWYAFGTMLYEALSGRRLSEGPSDEVRRKRVDGEPPLPLTDVDGDLGRLCHDLLQHASALRPSGPEVLARMASRRGEDELVASSVPALDEEHAVKLTGRDAEIQRLGDALEVTRGGHPSVALVHGRSGVGKTALVDQLVRMLGDTSPSPGGSRTLFFPCRDGRCITPAGDSSNCGGCGLACPMGRLCSVGLCG